jgi:hypothetical protein
MANDYVNEFYENLHQETLRISKEKYEKLQMLENKNYLLQRQVDELLIKISELQELVDQKMIIPSKKNKKIIKDVHFK